MYNITILMEREKFCFNIIKMKFNVGKMVVVVVVAPRSESSSLFFQVAFFLFISRDRTKAQSFTTQTYRRREVEEEFFSWVRVIYSIRCCHSFLYNIGWLENRWEYIQDDHLRLLGFIIRLMRDNNNNKKVLPTFVAMETCCIL